MKSIIIPFILFFSLLFSCGRNESPYQNNYSVEDKLKFINLFLKFYVEDSLVCNNLNKRLDWNFFKSTLYSEERLLLKKYAPNMKWEDIESQMGSFVLNEEHNEFLPNYKFFEEEVESQSDSIQNLKSNLYYTTMPVFTYDGNYVFVGFSEVSGLLSGHGEIIVFERKGNSWRELEREIIWIQ